MELWMQVALIWMVHVVIVIQFELGPAPVNGLQRANQSGAHVLGWYLFQNLL